MFSCKLIFPETCGLPSGHMMVETQLQDQWTWARVGQRTGHSIREPYATQHVEMSPFAAEKSSIRRRSSLDCSAPSPGVWRGRGGWKDCLKLVSPTPLFFSGFLKHRALVFPWRYSWEYLGHRCVSLLCRRGIACPTTMVLGKEQWKYIGSFALLSACNLAGLVLS